MALKESIPLAAKASCYGAWGLFYNFVLQLGNSYFTTGKPPSPALEEITTTNY